MANSGPIAVRLLLANHSYKPDILLTTYLRTQKANEQNYPRFSVLAPNLARNEQFSSAR
jgi:hypothetical protein